jgi:hypothetical protein
MKKFFLRSLLYSFILLAAQQLFLAGPSVLGLEAKTVAWNLVSFFPGEAVAVQLKVYLVVALWIILLLGGWRALRLFTNKNVRLGLKIGYLSGWAIFMLTPVLRYPAVFDAYLPTFAKDIIHKLSYVLPLEGLELGSVALLTLILLSGGLMNVLRPDPTRVGDLTLQLAKGKLLSAAAVAVILLGSLLLLSKRDVVAKGERERPDVFMIVIDSLRTDRADDQNVMPQLGRFAQDPQVASFRDHMIGVPRTFPSWVEMIKGEYAPKTRIRHMFPGTAARSDQMNGLVSSFKAAGYKTVAVSDFAGDIFPRFHAGFDEVVTPKLSIQTMIRMGTLQSNPVALMLILRDPLWQLFPELKQDPNFADPGHLGDQLLAEVEQAKDPVFAVAFFSAAHFPYAASFPYYNKFSEEDYRGDYYFLKNPELVAGNENVTEGDKDQVRALYDGALSQIDHELGRIFSTLKAAGRWDKSIVLITADHGESLYDAHREIQGHGEDLKGDFVTKVPLLVKLPTGKTPLRRKLEFLTRSIDVSATLQGAAGISGETGDGVDLSRWILTDERVPSLRAYQETGIWFSARGEAEYQRKRLYYPGITGLLNFNVGGTGDVVLHDQYENMIVTAKHRAWIRDDYKLVYFPTKEGAKFELYQRKLDPENLTDLAMKEPVTLAGMRRELFSFIDTWDQDRMALGDFVVPK